MPLIIGTTNIGDIYKGTTKIDSVYKGTTLVYTSGTWEQYLYEFIYHSLVPTTINSKVVKNKARVNTIYGNSVVENQLVQNGNFESTSGWYSINATNSVSNNTFTITKNSVDTTYVYRANASFPTVVENHYYLCSVYIKPSGNSSWRFRVGNNYGTSLSIVANNKTRLVQIMHPTSLGGFYSSVSDDQGQLASGGTCEFSEYEMIDLTQMFPINTPTTLTDTRVQALLNRGYIPYNAGTIKNVDVSEISSEPYNIFDGELEGGGMTSNGVDTTDNDAFRSKNYTNVVSSLTYTFEYDTNAMSPGTMYLIEYDANKNFIQRTSVYAQSSHDFSLTSETHYIRFYFYRYNSGWKTNIPTNVNICFHITGTRTGYAPHTDPQSITFKYQGSGVGTAHDTMEITSSAYVFTKNMVRYTFTGSEGWNAAGQISSGLYRYYSAPWVSTPNTMKTGIAQDGICNNFPTDKTTYNTATQESVRFGQNNQQLYVYLKQDLTSTSMQSYMVGTSVEYPLATPQVISIPKKHLGVVDLGSLSWLMVGTQGTNAQFYVSMSTTDIKGNVNADNMPNIYCSKYIIKTPNEFVSNANKVMTITLDQKVLRVGDQTFANATDFKNAMSGQYLFYETEDEVADITTQIKVESGGTLTTNWFSWKKNQIAKLRNITANGFTLTIESNGSGTLTGTPSNSYASLFENTNIYNNHIYLIDVNIKQNTNNLSFRFGCLNVNVSLSNISSGRNSKIITANNTILSSVGFADFTANVDIGTINAFYQIIDLTLAFPTDTPTSINDPRVQYIINNGYIPTDTIGTDTLVDSQVLPNIEFGVKAK